MLLPNEQEGNQDQEDNQKQEGSRAGNEQPQDKSDSPKSKKPFWVRFIPHFCFWIVVYFLFFLVKVRPWDFGNYVAWLIFSIVASIFSMLVAFLFKKK